LIQIGLVHFYNKEIFHVYYSTSDHDAYLMGQVVDPLSFTFSVQPAYYVSSKLLVGFKPFYGIALNKRVNIGDLVTQEYQINSNSYFFGTSYFTRYYFRDKVGARPYLDMGFGMIWTYREDTKLTKVHIGPYTETAVIKETRWNDPFLDIEAGIDYSPTIESRYIYSVSVQFKILLDEEYKIYAAHYGMGFKIGLLLN